MNKCVFLELVNIFGCPAIDLFASRLNKQVTTFVSWKPDPNALFIDAFSRPWHELNLYAFPLFSVFGLCINKIKQEKAQGMIIVPLWPAQTWFPVAFQMMTSVRVILPPDSIYLPYTNKKLQLHKTLQLMACQLSGDPLKGEEFRSLLNIIVSSWRKSTQSKHQYYIKRWHTFCDELNKDPYYTNEAEILEFLAAMHDKHLSYITINTAKSAISIHSQEKNTPIGNSEFVKSFMKGLFVLNPPRSRYTAIWDVKIVLDFPSSLENVINYI